MEKQQQRIGASNVQEKKQMKRYWLHDDTCTCLHTAQLECHYPMEQIWGESRLVQASICSCIVASQPRGTAVDTALPMSSRPTTAWTNSHAGTDVASIGTNFRRAPPVSTKNFKTKRNEHASILPLSLRG